MKAGGKVKTEGGEDQDQDQDQDRNQYQDQTKMEWAMKDPEVDGRMSLSDNWPRGG